MSLARTNVDKLRDLVSVRQFGATGNGVADDTTAIQTAISSGAKVIWFPSGTYRITSALNPVSNQQLTGFGATLTTDNLNFTNAIQITGCTNVVVQDLTISGPSGGDGFDMAIRIRDSSNVTVKNTLIQNIGRDVAMPNEKGFGVLIEGASNSAPVPGGNGCFNINVIDNTILDIKGFGDFRGDAVAITNARGVYVSGNTMGRCRRMTVSVTDYATDIQISDNEIFDSYLCGIDIEPNLGPSETGEIIIANNTIRNFGIKPAGYVGVQFFGIDLHSESFENVIVDGNIVIAEAAQAVSGIHGQNGSRNGVISNNIVVGNGHIETGISLYAGNGFKNLVISNNIIQDFTVRGIDSFANDIINISNNFLLTSTCETPISIVGVNDSSVITGNIVKVTTLCTQAIVATDVKKLIASNNVMAVASGNGVQLTVSAAGNFYYTYTNNSYEKTGATGGDAINLLGNIGSLFFILGGNVALNASNAIVRSGLVAPLDDAWPPIVPTATAANIAAVGNAINTANKYVGKQVWDSTNNRMMRARGPFAADPWDVIDGSASVTPT